MGSICLKTCFDQPEPGKSKLLGNPDVWEGFEWPCMEEDGELYDLTFICQINLADIAAYDTEGLLPKTGMLYFFYDLDEMPVDSANRGSARVIYYDGDISELEEMVLTDEEGQPIAFKQLALEFETVEAGFLSDCEETHLMLGKPSLDYGTIEGELENWQLLLQFDSMETEDTVINFTDEGILCFFIELDKLRVGDFSDVRIRQIYS